jgi:hypothetical protein
MKANEFIIEGVAGAKKCWPGHRKVGTQPGTGKNAGKRVNDCEKIKEDEVEESGLQYYTGVKKHGKEYMKKAAAAGREGASQKELGALKDKYSKAHKNEGVAEGETSTPAIYVKGGGKYPGMTIAPKGWSRIRDIKDEGDSYFVMVGNDSDGFNIPKNKVSPHEIKLKNGMPITAKQAFMMFNGWTPDGEQGVAEASALEKFRQGAAEREKKHDAIEKDMKARHARGEEDMKGSIDRLEKHVNTKESVEEAAKKGLYYYVNKRKKAGTSRDASHPKAPTAQAWKDAAKTAKKEDLELEQEFDMIESIIESIADQHAIDAELVWEDLSSLTDDELYVFAVTSEIVNEDWQKANKRDKTDGMSRKAVNAYRRENPGSKLKTAVTTKPSKLKKGGKASKRRKSYCSRSRGQMKMHSISCAKTPDKAICKARRRWNC